jgi:hypothetical protein
MRAVRSRAAQRADDRVLPIAAAVAVVVGVVAWLALSPTPVASDPFAFDSFAGFGEPINLVLR